MQYNLVCSSDNNYIPYFFVLSQSIVDHIEPSETNANDSLVFNVLIDNSVDLQEVTNKAQQFIERNQACGIFLNFEWHIVDEKEFAGYNKLIKDNHIAYSTYYRLIIDRILSPNIERFLYLDIDMLVLTDIRKIFNEYPLNNKVLGAVVDPGVKNTDKLIASQETHIQVSYKNNSKKIIKIPKATYFNAGMLLVNMVEWRKQNIGQKCLNLASQLNLKYHDQDLLNIVCQGQVELINLSWNYQTPMFYVLYNKDSGKYDILNSLTPHLHWQSETPSAEEFEQISAAPNIIHFSGMKPWTISTKYECGLNVGSTVPPSSRLSFYLNQWKALSKLVPEFKPIHTLNTDSISIDTLKLYKLNKKRKQERLLLLSLIALSLGLNIIMMLIYFIF